MILTEFNKELYEQGLKEDAWEEANMDADCFKQLLDKESNL